MSETKSQFGAIFQFVRPYRFYLLSVLTLTVLLSILTMLPPLLIRGIIDRVLTQGDRSIFFTFAFCLIAVRLFTALSRYIQTIGIAYLGQRFVFDIRTALYEHMMHLSLRFYGKHSVGKLVTRLMGDSGTVQQMLTAQSINVISDLVCATFAISVTFFLNWRLATLLCIIVVSFVVNYRINIKRIRKYTRSSRSAYDHLSGGVQNRLTASLAVKTFGTEGREHGAFQEQSDLCLGLGREAAFAGNAFSMNTQLIRGLGRSTIYFAGCALVLRGELSYGDVVAFTTYAMQLLGPAVRFSGLAQQLQNVSIAIERLFEVLGEEPEITDSDDPVPMTELKGEVEFEGVHFHYEETNPVIRGFDLHVAPGETIAFIGPTGCGKSTLLSLIMRFFDVCEGRLLMDGNDIRDIRLHDLRRQFGIVLQEPLLFDATISENIRYSRPDATQEEIEAATKAAEIHDFITGLPDGYESRLGDEGVEISVGQKQRITIARAIVADPAILIMDEATSALDSESEKLIQKAMDRVLEGRTSFVVAHRLSTIRNADKIVLLVDGTIAEIGGHDELMAIPNGRYHDLYTKHMGAGVLDDTDM